MTLAKIATLKQQLQSEDLDDKIHEAKGEEAAAINNGGIDSQVDYLLASFGTDGTLKLLRELTKKS